MTLTTALGAGHLSHTPPDVFADLRNRIISLELPPGSQLSRAELQARYAVSSTPVRDALLRLQEEGLVEIYPQSRTIVSRIDLRQAREAHFLRSSVEQNIVKELAREPDADLLKTLSHIVSLQEHHAEQQDLDVFFGLDLTFHRTLFEAAGFRRLFAVIRRESVHIDRLRALHLPLGDKVTRIVTEHRRIVEAIDAGSPAQAEEAMAFHLSQSIAIASQLSRHRPDYFKS
jgi:GntR family transcriptional regulator, rspAB operon transcriptional repressor